jgi:pimeloyl-ACP methyl ester carboxylesterase
MRRLVGFSPASVVRIFFLAALLFPGVGSPVGHLTASESGEVVVHDRDGSPVTKITDGDLIRIRFTLASKAQDSLTVDFSLQGSAAPVASCEIPGGADRCETDLFLTLGWHWGAGGQAQGDRIIQASGVGIPAGLNASIQVAPRPVVMVHGFASTWEAWVNYLGPDGFLQAIGVPGFAVGDGQVAGVMDTGSLDTPKQRTNSIAENAAVLGEYIANVKKATGAQQVDLVSHSMGGLIARYYIDRVMSDRDVAQLIMIGSPMAGTDCADLPAALGLYLPASLEIRPGYVTDIFNRQVTHRHGVPFHALAGNPILQPFKSPCTQVPSDLAVSLESVTAIPVQVSELPVLHMNLNLSNQVFKEFVEPLLQTPPGGFPQEPDPPQEAAAEPPLQFTRMFTGHLEAGSSQEVTIQIDAGVSVASFALYDTTRTLSVTVRGASGNVIDLDADKNGLVVIQDPTTLFYLGYGFENPKPGAWKVNLATTAKTPASGADYALTAHFVGGATLDAQTDTLLPQAGDPVQLTVKLALGAQALDLEVAQAVIRAPDGGTETLDLTIDGPQGRLTLNPQVSGLYGVDVSVIGRAPDGTTIERTSFLALEVQPLAGPLPQVGLDVGIAMIVISLFGLVVLGVVLVLRWRLSH